MQCDDCHAWLHQVCALFNVRNNQVRPLSLPSLPSFWLVCSSLPVSCCVPQAEAIKYYCPECTLKRRKVQNSGPTCAPLSARDLKHNSFSKYIEERCVPHPHLFSHYPTMHVACPHSPTDVALCPSLCLPVMQCARAPGQVLRGAGRVGGPRGHGRREERQPHPHPTSPHHRQGTEAPLNPHYPSQCL